MLEKNEENGTITVQNLAKAANAIDCELVLALRPKQKIRFSQIIWNTLLPESITHPGVIWKPDIRKQYALAAIVRMHMEDPGFRRKRGWTQRQSERAGGPP